MHIDHINISAPMELLERVRDFYCALFDLENGFRPEFRNRGFWLYSGDEPLIHLSESDNHVPNNPRAHLDHVAFQTSGIDGIIAKLDSMGIDFRSTYLADIKLSQLFFTDPAGTGIEVNFPNEIRS
jgi:4-hydroxyphenylpyruvate dioxygenase-like putative hemolysin